MASRLLRTSTRAATNTRSSRTSALWSCDLAENRFFPIFSPFDADVDGSRWIGVLEDLRQLDRRDRCPGPAGELGDFRRALIEPPRD